MKKHKILLLAIILLFFLLRLPSLWEPVYYGDECIYLTLGQAFNKGKVFYKHIFDHKPPLIYLTTAFTGGRLSFFKAFVIAWNAINIYLIYLLTHLLVNKNKKTAGLFAAFLFALFSFLPEGRIANGELFMIMPACLGLFLALKAKKLGKPNLWLAVGLSFSIAFLYKPPIALELFGLSLAFFIYNKKNFQEIWAVLKNKKLYLLFLGFSGPILASVIYYWYQGAATPYIRSALMQNIGYISSWSGGSNSGLLLRGIILSAALGLVYLLRKKLGFNFYLILLLSLMSGFGSFLSERPYPHYLIQAAPWTALLLTLMFFKPKKIKTVATLGFVSLIISGIIYYQFWWYPILPYYKNFYKFITRQKSQQEYFNYFEDNTYLKYQLAKYLRSKTAPNENIFVWSNSSSCIYALSNRQPPGRYVTDFHISDFGGKEETIQALNQNPPKIIVMDKNEYRDFEQLEDFVDKNYFQTLEFENFLIYKKKNVR